MNIKGGKYAWPVVATTVVYLALTLSLPAQVQTTTSTAAGKDTVVTKIQNGEVVTVSGNDLLVRMADGSMRHFANVPEYATATVDGKQLSIHDLKPGMKLQRTITTTTTPMTITTVQTVKGKVWAINPPLSVILTLEDGKNQQFKIPQGQKFDVDGKMVDAWGVRKGMTLTATKIVEEPAAIGTQQTTVTGETPAAPATGEAATATGHAAPAPNVPVLVAEGNEEAVTAPAEAPTETPVETPEAPHGTAIGLICLLVVAALIAWFMLRKKRSRS